VHSCSIRDDERQVIAFASTERPIRHILVRTTIRGRHHRNARREGDVAKNARQRLIDGLNKDLQAEFQAIIMYRLYASMVQGPYRQELRTFFANEIPEELMHAQMLADKIAALGGTPASTPSPVKVVSEPKAMLEAALEAEIATLARYVARRKEAEAAGEHGLAAEMDTLIADESKHRDELRQMLARWP
jgi:bacterioferritin